MRKNVLLVMLTLLSAGLFAQDTLTGWNFPSNTGKDSLNANLGTTQNKAYDIRFQWVLTSTTDSTLNTVVFVPGATTFAAASAGWDAGIDKKFWSIKFKAANYINFKLSAKQKGDPTGPRDFKLQWRLSSTTYSDVPNGTITVANDWTTGVVSQLPVPITNQGTSSIYLRWIMTSNTSIDGGTVNAAGKSMIDDILVTGQGTLGQDEILYTNRLTISPNPNHGIFSLTSTEPIEFLSVCDIQGRTILSIPNPTMKQTVAIPDVKPGMYFLNVKFDDRELMTTRFIIQ